VVNYACHPTTLAWKNTLISPDYVGAMRQIVEEKCGGPCLFLQGASGDLGPREGYVGDAAVADRNGGQLGYAVLSALESMPQAGTQFTYAGPVVSGATLGTWKHIPLADDAQPDLALWRWRRWTVDLPYRANLPNAEATKAELDRWRQAETTAQKADDHLAARNCRAQIERMRRELTRTAQLPPGPTFPLPIKLGRLGDGYWLLLEGEYYQAMQIEL